MHNEEKLLDHVRSHLTDEDVLAAGWFEPLDRALMQSTSAGLALLDGVGAGYSQVPTASAQLPDPVQLDVAATNEAAAIELAKASEVPASVILAVTPTKLYAFHANPVLATASVKDVWKVWSRDAIEVHGSKVLLSLVISLREIESGRVLQWEGSKTHSAGPKHVLRELLTGD